MQTWLFDRPVLKDFGSFTIVNYGLYFAIGMSLFLQGMYVVALMLGIDVNWDYALFVSLSYTLCFTLGTKLLRIFYSRKEFLQSPSKVLRKNGNSFYGGVAGFIVAAGMVASNFEEISFTKQVDITFLCFPIFQVFIRIACASYGCCYGHEYHGQTSVTYHDPNTRAFKQIGAIPVHATQLYSIAKNLVLFVVMLSLFNRFPSMGLPTALWLILYPSLRFFVDFTRYWKGKRFKWGLRSSQRISVGLFLLGILSMNYIPLKPYSWSGEYAGAMLSSLNYLIAPLIAFCFSLIAFGVSFSTCKRSPKNT